MNCSINRTYLWCGINSTQL